jgi:alkylation response protein AidB-like acyl-CoA dehydrogenase
MPTKHDHQPGLFDAGHRHACAFEAGLLGHYQHVQREEAALWAAGHLARQAQRRATWALCSAGACILLATIALLKG